MRTKPILRYLTILAILCAASVLATDGKWNVNNGGNWSDPSRWTNSQIPGDVVGSFANIDFNITANRTVTIDQAVTLGRIRFNDATTSSHDWTLATSGGNVLTLAIGSGVPLIEVINRTVTFNASLNLAGSQGFRKSGGGTLTLSNTGNTNTLGGNIIMGGGTMALNNANMGVSFSGKHIVTNGTLRATSDACLGAYPASFVADRITLSTAGVLMNNTSDTIIETNNGIVLGTGGGQLQAGWSRPLTINSIISGAGGLTVRADTTPGVISLNANNTYTGPTVVGHSISGIWAWCEVNGSLAAASAVTVRTNGSLGGIGTINGPLVVTTNAILSPGPLARPGTLTVNNNAAITNAAFNFDLGSTTTVGGGVNDLLQVNGDLTMVGPITISINPSSGALASGTYRLINYTGALDISQATITFDNPRFSATLDTSVTNQINVTVSGGPASLVWTGTGGTNWDVAITQNWIAGENPEMFYQGDAVKFDDTGVYDTNGVYEVAPRTSIGTLLPSSVSVNMDGDLTLTSSAQDGRLGGTMSLYKGGAGTLTLSTGNANQPNWYEGATVITNGILRVGNGRVLGAADVGTYATNGGTLDVNAQNIGFEPVIIQGAGMGGLGALVSNGTADQQNSIRQLTLAGDATIGGTRRFDLRGIIADTFLSTGGQPYNLTKVGAMQFSIVSAAVDPALANVEVKEGTISLEGNSTGFGDPTKTLTVREDATFLLWGTTNQVNKIIVLQGGTNSNINSGSGSNNIVGPITLDADSLWTVAGVQLNTHNTVSGAGGLTKAGAAKLQLLGTNTYAGPTLINAGQLSLGANAKLATTPLISLNSASASFDVSELAGGFTLASGQTLGGLGMVTGLVHAVASTTVAPGNGNSPGTFTFENGLTLNNAKADFHLGSDPYNSLANDMVMVNGPGLTASGVTTIKISPLGPLSTTIPYNLFQNNGTPLPSGSEANFTVTTDSRYNFSLLPTDTTAPFVQVQVSGTASAATLIWKGNDPTNPTWWDMKTTSNWLNSASMDKFYLGDTAVFDDSAVSSTVDLIGAVQPSIGVMSNATKAITFQGAGMIQAGSFSGDGTGLTTFANTTGNLFIYGLTNNSGTMVFNNDGTNNFGAGLLVNGGEVRIQNPYNNLASSITLNAGTLRFNQTNTATVPTLILGGGAQLVKEGTNLLTLSGANSFDGQIQVNSGTLRAGHASALGGINGGTVIASGATLNVNGFNLGSEPVAAVGAGVDGAGAIINLGAGQNNALFNVTLNGNTTFGGTGRWDIRGTTSSPGGLSTGGNAYGITKVGANQVSLVNVNVDIALGDIEVREGTFHYEATTTGLGNPAKTLTIRSNATVQMYNASNPLDKMIRLEDGGRLRANNANVNQVVGPILVPNGMGKVEADSSVTIHLLGQISGEGGLTKGSAGTVLLGASNIFAGPITNIAGTLMLSNNLAVGTNKMIWNVSTTGGSGLTGTRVTLAGGITTPPGVWTSFNSSSTGDIRSTMYATGGTNEWTGPIDLRGPNGIVNFAADTTNVLILSGPITNDSFAGTLFVRGSGFGMINNTFSLPNATLAKTDSSTWLLNQSGSIWSNSTIAVGTIMLGANNALCPTAKLLMGQNDAQAAALDLNGFNQWLQAFNPVSGTGTRRIGNNSTNADSVFTYDGGTNVSVFAGQFVDNLNTNGNRKLSLTVASGTLQLNNTNTYTGTTTISGGTLAVGTGGSLASPLIDLQGGAVLDTSGLASGLALISGQTLKGNGTVAGSLTVGPGAVLSAGASIGALTITNGLAMQTGSTNVFELNLGAGTNDVVNAAVITYGGTLQLNNLGAPLAIGNTFKLFNAPAYAGAFDAIVPATPGTGLAWDVSQLTVTGTLGIKTGTPSTPTNITFAVSGSTLTLTWPSEYLGWTAQSNSVNVADPGFWFDIPGSAAATSLNITVDPGTPKAFYRLRYQP